MLSRCIVRPLLSAATSRRRRKAEGGAGQTRLSLPSMFRVEAKVPFWCSVTGGHKPFERFSTDRDTAFRLQKVGLVTIIDEQWNLETKDGQPSSSQADPRRQRPTYPYSRAGRSSQSMTAGDSTQEQTSSTPVTVGGGKSTTARPRLSAVNGGRKTERAPKNTGSRISRAKPEPDFPPDAA